MHLDFMDKVKHAIFVFLLLLVLLFAGCRTRTEQGTTTVKESSSTTLTTSKSTTTTNIPTTGKSTTTITDTTITGNQYTLGPGFHNITITGWENRDYRLYVPKSYDKLRPMPVMLVLHGGGGNGWTLYSLTCPDGKSTNSKCMNNIAEREGFIVVYPNGVENPSINEVRTWNGGGGKEGYVCASGYACDNNFDDIGYFNALLDNLEDRINVDKNRVYATGISNGAAMSHRLACQLSDRITAIAPISFGNQYSANANCNPSRSVPVVEFHGTKDPYATYDGGQGHSIFGQENGLVVGAPQSVADWAERNGCSSNATQEMPDSSNDGTTVTKISYYGCRNDGDVVLYRINDGGHTWPDGQEYAPAWTIGKTTRDINANEVMWDFLKRYSI